MDLKTLLFSFEGRIGRQQYLLTVLAKSFVYGLGILLACVLMAFKMTVIAVPLLIVLVVSTIWTSWALVVKRVHDRDHSGYYALIAFIPLVGLWLVIEAIFLRGTVGDNQFGKDPVA